MTKQQYRTMTVSSLDCQCGGIVEEKACLANTNPDAVQQEKSGADRRGERAGERKLDRWRSVLMGGEREVWRSQGWIVFLFPSPEKRLKASG